MFFKQFFGLLVQLTRSPNSAFKKAFENIADAQDQMLQQTCVLYDFISLPRHFSHAAQTNNLQGLCLYETFFHSGKKQFCIVCMVGLLTVIPPKSNSADLEVRESIMKERDFPT